MKVDKRDDNIDRIYNMILKRAQKLIKVYNISYADISREMYKKLGSPCEKHSYVYQVLQGKCKSSMNYLIRLSDAVDNLCKKKQDSIDAVRRSYYL